MFKWNYITCQKFLFAPLRVTPTWCSKCKSFFFCLLIFLISSNLLVLKQHHQNKTSLYAIPQFASNKKNYLKYTSIDATCVPYTGLNINHEELGLQPPRSKVLNLVCYSSQSLIQGNPQLNQQRRFLFLLSSLSHALGQSASQEMASLETV